MFEGQLTSGTIITPVPGSFVPPGMVVISRLKVRVLGGVAALFMLSSAGLGSALALTSGQAPTADTPYVRGVEASYVTLNPVDGTLLRT